MGGAQPLPSGEARAFMASGTPPAAAMHPCWEDPPHRSSVKTREEKKKQWKGSSSGVGLSPSFRVAEAGSPKPPLWHVPWAPLLLHHRVLGPAAASSARAGRREEAAVLWRRSGSRTARTSLALQSIAPVWGKLIPPGRCGKPASPWFSYTYTMRQESLTKQKLTLPGRSKESHGDVQGKGFWRETRRALRSSK